MHRTPCARHASPSGHNNQDDGKWLFQATRKPCTATGTGTRISPRRVRTSRMVSGTAFWLKGRLRPGNNRWASFCDVLIFARRWWCWFGFPSCLTPGGCLGSGALIKPPHLPAAHDPLTVIFFDNLWPQGLLRQPEPSPVLGDGVLQYFLAGRTLLPLVFLGGGGPPGVGPTP